MKSYKFPSSPLARGTIHSLVLIYSILSFLSISRILTYQKGPVDEGPTFHSCFVSPPCTDEVPPTLDFAQEKGLSAPSKQKTLIKVFSAPSKQRLTPTNKEPPTMILQKDTSITQLHQLHHQDPIHSSIIFDQVHSRTRCASTVLMRF